MYPPCTLCGNPVSDGDCFAGPGPNSFTHTACAERARTLVREAKEVATLAHGEQMYGGSGKPYVYHLETVATALARKYPNDPELEAVGWLHDIVEDCGVSLDILEARFGKRIATIVDLVTQRDGTDYPFYIMRLLPHADACRAKLEDMEHNSGGNLDHPKYGNYLPVLREAVSLHNARERITDDG